MDPWLAPDGAPRKDVSQMSNPDRLFLGVESSASGRAWRDRLDARGNVARNVRGRGRKTLRSVQRHPEAVREYHTD
jgi:hypothetical protein